MEGKSRKCVVKNSGGNSGGSGWKRMEGKGKEGERVRRKGVG